MGVLALFLYVGVEVIAGDTIIAYGISLNIPAEDAKFFTLFTLMAMVATYALGVVLIPKYMSQSFALKASAILGIILSFCIVYTTGFVSVLLVAAFRYCKCFSLASYLALALKGLGKFTERASSLLIMAISRRAIIPPLYGALVDNKKEELIVTGVNKVNALAEASSFGYWILLPCYLIILYYAFWGQKLGLKKVV